MHSMSARVAGLLDDSPSSVRFRGSFSIEDGRWDEFPAAVRGGNPEIPTTPKPVATPNDRACSIDDVSGSRSSSEGQLSHPSPPARACSVVQRKVEVLLVEDNKINQMVVSRMMKNAGYNCTIAENGVKALETVENRLFDVILMDCLMPEMDGFECTRRLRQDPRFEAVPIIALTACTADSDLQECIRSGMSEVLNKPVNWPKLQAAIQKYLCAS